jgi:hypothetical protein
MTFHTTKKLLALTCAGFLAVSTLAGCGAKEDAETPTDPTEDVSTPVDDTPTLPTGDFTAAEWAADIVTSDEILFHGSANGMELTIYKMAIHPASRDSMLVDPDTNVPVFTEGADMVWMNYVWTNNTGETLLYSNLNGGLKYEDYPYMGTNPGVTDISFRQELGLSGTATRSGVDIDPAGEPWLTGTSIAVSDNIEYRPGVTTILVNFYPTLKDAEGNNIRDTYKINDGTFVMP